MICVAINCSAYGCLSQFSIENFLSYGLEHENALQLFYHMNVVQNKDNQNGILSKFVFSCGCG